jgi:putative ABC transport system permease protein
LLQRLAILNLKHRPIRTLLGVMAVAVEVTMILTVVGLGRGTVEEAQMRAQSVGADIMIRPPGSSYFGLSAAPLSDKLVDFVRSQPHVRFATASVLYPLGGINTITGLDLDEFAELSGGFRYVSGGPFHEERMEVIVDRYYARQNGVRVGDTIELLNQPWKVAGITEPGKLARVVVPKKVLQDLTGNPGKISQIYVRVDDPANLEAVIADLRSKLENYPIYSMEELLSLIRVDNVPGLRAFIYVVIGLSVIVGFLVVFLSNYTAVLERTREIGVLKSLGASPGFILGIVYRETIMLTLLGTAVGIALSFATRAVIENTIPATLTQAVVPDWWPIAAVISLAGALLGASYPGLKAAWQDPIEALAYE